MSKPWIGAANAAGTLPQEVVDFLSCMLVPDREGRLITMPPDTWQGM